MSVAILAVIRPWSGPVFRFVAYLSFNMFPSHSKVEPEAGQGGCASASSGPTAVTSISPGGLLDQLVKLEQQAAAKQEDHDEEVDDDNDEEVEDDNVKRKKRSGAQQRKRKLEKNQTICRRSSW